MKLIFLLALLMVFGGNTVEPPLTAASLQRANSPYVDSCLRVPSTCIRNFESATCFVRIQKFPSPHVSVLKSNLPIHTYPSRLRIHCLHPERLWEYWQESMRRKEREICILLCLREPRNEVAILNTVFTVKNWSRHCYVTG